MYSSFFESVVGEKIISNSQLFVQSFYYFIIFS